MNHKEELIAALRSGRFSPLTREPGEPLYLRQGNRYSIGGVACAISGLGAWEDAGGDIMVYKVGDAAGYIFYPPSQVRDYFDYDFSATDPKDFLEFADMLEAGQ